MPHGDKFKNNALGSRHISSPELTELPAKQHRCGHEAHDLVPKEPPDVDHNAIWRDANLGQDRITA